MIKNFKTFYKLDKSIFFGKGNDTLPEFIGKNIKLFINEKFTFDFFKKVENYEPKEYVIDKKIEIAPFYGFWQSGKEKIIFIDINLTDNINLFKELDPYGEDDWDENKIELSINVHKNSAFNIRISQEGKPNTLNYEVKTDKEGVGLIMEMVRKIYEKEPVFNNRFREFKNTGKKHISENLLNEKIMGEPKFMVGELVIYKGVEKNSRYNSKAYVTSFYKSLFEYEYDIKFLEDDYRHSCVESYLESATKRIYSDEDPYGEENWALEDL